MADIPLYKEAIETFTDANGYPWHTAIPLTDAELDSLKQGI